MYPTNKQTISRVGRKKKKLTHEWRNDLWVVAVSSESCAWKRSWPGKKEKKKQLVIVRTRQEEKKDGLQTERVNVLSYDCHFHLWRQTDHYESIWRKEEREFICSDFIVLFLCSLNQYENSISNIKCRWRLKVKRNTFQERKRLSKQYWNLPELLIKSLSSIDHQMYVYISLSMFITLFKLDAIDIHKRNDVYTRWY